MKSKFRKILITIGVFVNILAAVFMFASAYVGVINPSSFALAGLLNMTFPAWIMLNLIMLVIDAIFKRKLLWIPIAAFLACGGPLLSFSPLNIFSRELTDSEKKHSFTILTYNVMNWLDAEGKYQENTNRTLTYILKTDADIVCMQECTYLGVFRGTRLTDIQIDSIKRRYPYRRIEAGGQSIFSKYPFTLIDLGVKKADRRDMAAYLVEIGNEIVTIYNLHLYSLRLNSEDKKAYEELTELNTEEDLEQAQSRLFSKYNSALRERARQARLLRAHIDKTGGNIIACGDFNDVPNCYAVRTIAGDKMADAYAENAFGPTITFNANRFYFRIDHVLYQGKLTAVDIERGDLKCSDHYPLLTTFVWNESEND